MLGSGSAPVGRGLRLSLSGGLGAGAYSPLPRAAPPNPSRSTPEASRSEAKGERRGRHPSPDREASRSPSASSGQAPRRESGAGWSRALAIAMRRASDQAFLGAEAGMAPQSLQARS